MDQVDVGVTTCRGCGAALATFPMAHFEAGRCSTTLELLCPTHGCEHHDRPDERVGTVWSAGTAHRTDGAEGRDLPVQRRRDEPWGEPD